MPKVVGGFNPAAFAGDYAQMSQQARADWQQKNPQDVGSFRAFILSTKKPLALRWYNLVNPMAERVHASTARELAIVGGNRSSKTDTSLAELAIRLTGIVPDGLRATYPREKLAKLPIRARVVCNSLTDTLEPVIKPKLRWDQWNGVGDPDEGRGHYGWIPQHCLVGGSWEKAYSEKYRTLRVHAYNQQDRKSVV